MKVSVFFNKLIAEGESQSSIARKCGISQSTVNNLLNGGDETPRTSTLRRIAGAYNKPLSFFLEDWSPDKLNIVEESPGFGINEEEQQLLDVFRGSKTAKLAIRELLEMSEEQRLDWIIQQQDKIRKGD